MWPAAEHQTYVADPLRQLLAGEPVGRLGGHLRGDRLLEGHHAARHDTGH